MNDFDEALKALDRIDPMEMFGEPIKGKTYKADGWKYRDVRWFTPTQYDELKTILGIENLVVLSEHHRTGAAGTVIGGQFLISPAGMQRAIKWAEDQQNRQSEKSS